MYITVVYNNTYIHTHTHTYTHTHALIQTYTSTERKQEVLPYQFDRLQSSVCVCLDQLF